MQFDPAIHTKEFLLDNPKVAFELAKNSVEFSTCDLASDLELIGLVDTWGGQTVAHMFAQYQPEWLKSEASKSPEILRLANKVGHTVAHWLAQYQPEWLQSDAYKSPEILMLTSNSGVTVAHRLAQYQPEWLQSDASKSDKILRMATNDGSTVAHTLATYQPEWLQSEASTSPDILRLANNSGYTVAHELAQFQLGWLQSDASKSPEILLLADRAGLTVANVIVLKQSESINHQPLMQKQILTLDFSGKLLAEIFTEKYGDTHGLDTSTMAMKLIEQGAAYKHSKPMALKVGDTLLNQCQALIEDNIDAKISFKQLMATYSTFHHNVSKIINTDLHETLEQWQDILLKSENMIRQHLNAHPELYDNEHTVDIFCEPADIFLKKLQSERHLSAIQYSIDTADVEPIKQAIY